MPLFGQNAHRMSKHDSRDTQKVGLDKTDYLNMGPDDLQGMCWLRLDLRGL